MTRSYDLTQFGGTNTPSSQAYDLTQFGGANSSPQISNSAPVTAPTQVNTAPQTYPSALDTAMQYNKGMMVPTLMTPSSALQEGGYIVGQNPIGRAAEEAFAAIPFGLAEAPGLLATQAAKLPGVAEYIANLAGVVGKNVAFGAAANEIPSQFNQGQTVEQKAENSVAPSAIGALIAKPIVDIFGALRPSNLLKSSLSPDELQQNLNASAGTTTGLGDVISSPFLKRQYENVLTKLPFSGANEKMQQAAQQVYERGYSLINNLIGDGDPASINEKVNNTLQDVFQQQRAAKNALYGNVNQLADQSNLQLQLPTFAKTASKYANALNDTTMLKYEPESGALIKKLANYQNPVENTVTPASSILDSSGNAMIPAGQQTTYPSLQEANILKGKMNDYANLSAQSPDPNQRYLANVFGDLRDSLKTDIKSSINDSGNDELKDAYQKAEYNYANNFSPLLDKQLYKFISGSADPDNLVTSFLKTSKSADRSNLLGKLLNNLPVSSQQAIAGSYLGRAVDNEGTLNPASLNNLIKNLGTNQYKALFPNPLDRQALNNYRKLYQMNTTAVNAMANPATGQKNLDVLPLLLAHGFTGGVGAAEGEAHGGHGILGGIAGALAPGLLARPVVNALTSQGIRNSLVKSMINPINTLPSTQFGMGAVNALARQGNQQQ